MRRLLYIGHVWPEPTSSAAGERTLSILRTFNDANWNVVFATAAERNERSEHLDHLTSETAAIALNDDGFDPFVADLHPDVVIFDRFMTEEQYGWRVEQTCPAALRVLDTVDLHCLRRARQNRTASGENLEKQLLCSDDAKREIAAIWRSDLSLIISRYEQQLLERVFSVSPALLHYLPFMVTAGARDRPTPDFAERRHFATIGNFLHAPNTDSVEWLHQEIWPLIRKKLPEGELQIFGAYTPDKIKALDSPTTGFRVHGWAPDAIDALSAVRVCLAPLRFGAGLKGKILDAMIAGTPVVTTLVGAEAMGVESPMADTAPWCGRIVDDAPAIAEAAVGLHEDFHTWSAAQQRGRDILVSEFASEALGPSLLERVEECLADLSGRRESNFTGAMLREHHHRSTEFMARWIQAKNANLDR